MSWKTPTCGTRKILNLPVIPLVRTGCLDPQTPPEVRPCMGSKTPILTKGIWIPSLKLTWHLKMVVSNRNLLFQRSIFRCHVSFRECNSGRRDYGMRCEKKKQNTSNDILPQKLWKTNDLAPTTYTTLGPRSTMKNKGFNLYRNMGSTAIPPLKMRVSRRFPWHVQKPQK